MNRPNTVTLAKLIAEYQLGPRCDAHAWHDMLPAAEFLAACGVFTANKDAAHDLLQLAPYRQVAAEPDRDEELRHADFVGFAFD